MQIRIGILVAVAYDTRCGSMPTRIGDALGLPLIVKQVHVAVEIDVDRHTSNTLRLQRVRRCMNVAPDRVTARMASLPPLSSGGSWSCGPGFHRTRSNIQTAKRFRDEGRED